jgi:hypothetical protein
VDRVIGLEAQIAELQKHGCERVSREQVSSVAKRIELDHVLEFVRVRLSQSLFMRDMLYSEIANVHGIPNIPDDPDLAIYAARHLCEMFPEPLQNTFGRVSI